MMENKKVKTLINFKIMVCENEVRRDLACIHI